MRFQCVHCLGVVAIDDADAGLAVACGHCGGVVVVPATRFAAGAVINDFVIVRELGTGGMGKVYLAHQLSLDRPAALKVLLDQFSSDAEFIGNFVREARAAAKINHPSIVQAYAVGEEDGTYFFAMEYAEGTTLREVLARSNRIVASRALEIGQEIAEALDFAWVNQGLVHRDIKPDNIILREQGHVKLADLGLARVRGDILGSAIPGEVYGTPEYVAPEQLLGNEADNRVDIYSLGGTLYHALTGRPPYAGQTPFETARMHLAEPLVPPHVVADDIPEPVSRLIEVMLAKRPEHRYVDAGELASDIARVRQGRPPLRPVAAGSQEPLSLDLLPPPPAAPPPPADGGAGDMTVVRAAPPEALAVEAAATRAATPTPGSSAAGTRPPAAGRSRRRLALVAGLLLLVGAAAAGIALFLRSGQTPAAGDAETGRGAAPGGLATRPATSGAHQAILSLIQAKAPAADILRQTASYLRDHPQPDDSAKQLLDATAPLVEAEFQTLREAEHTAELATWRTRATELQEQAKLAAAEQERLAREAEADRQRKQQEEEQAKVREKAQQELAAERDRLRREAIDACRRDAYGEARLLFETMAQSREEQFRVWAQQRQACINLAEKAYNLVCNSKEKLQGTRISVPDKPTRGKVELIDRRQIHVVFTEKVLNDKGEELREKVLERASLALADVREPQMWDLCEAAWSKDNKDGSELDLMFGAYLLARGMYLGEARKRLTATSLAAEAAPLLEELTACENVLRGKKWDEDWAKLQLLLDQGDTAGAKRLAKALKQAYPDEYGRREAEVEKRLQGP